MNPIDTSQPLTIFPQPIGWKMIGGSILTILLGVLGVVLAVDKGSVVFALMTGWLAPLGVWMFRVFLKRRKEGNKDASLMLSPEGLRLMSGTTGLIPWRDVKRLGSFSVKGNPALTIHVDESAWARLNQTKFVEKSRKLDAALGIHVLIYFQQQLELPIADVAQLLHQYSIAHGGPALQPDP